MISNPVFDELAALGLVSRDNLVRICEATRDKNIPVYRDRESGVILLERVETDTAYYESDKPGDRADGQFIAKLRSGKNITSSMLEDVNRRFAQFEDAISNRRICDFGTGYGFFLDKCLKVAKKVCGVELRKDCLEDISTRLGKRVRLEKSIDDFEGEFDLVTMFHVLEHIPHQVPVLKSIRQKLHPNGRLIVEVPHAEDFLIKDLDLKAFHRFTFWSEHLVLHTRKSLEAVLFAAGFDRVSVLPYQRYGFTNHLHWLREGKPGGHEHYRHLYDGELDGTYRKYLENNFKCDTLIAVAIM